MTVELIPNPEKVRLCEPPDGCGFLLPLEKFPNLEYGHLVCEDCARTLPSRKKTQAMVDALGSKLAKANDREKLNSPHIRELVHAVVERVGGLGQLADKFITQLEQAEREDAGSAKVLNGYAHINKLILYGTQHIETSPDAQEMSDEELSAAIRKTQSEILMDQMMNLDEADQVAVLKLLEKGGNRASRTN